MNSSDPIPVGEKAKSIIYELVPPNLSADAMDILCRVPEGIKFDLENAISVDLNRLIERAFVAGFTLREHPESMLHL